MQRTLHSWEEHLKPFFERIQLLGELPLTTIECDAIGLEIRKLIKILGLKKGTDKLASSFKRTFVAYLALTAAYNTNREYWGVIVEAVDIANPSMLHHPIHHWGQLFLDIVKELGLQEFAEVDSSTPYVTAIRLHGGIPAYSLPDFFQRILLPSIERAEYKDLPTAEVLDLLLARSTVQQFVDDPVLDFLKHGDQYALDFVDACRRMVQEYTRTGELPRAEVQGIPSYVLEAFRQYKEDTQEGEKSTRLRVPFLRFHPGLPGFELSLPPEPVESGCASWVHFWQIEGIEKGRKGFVDKVRVRVRQVGNELVTREGQFALDKSFESLNIALFRFPPGEEGNARLVCCWSLSIFPSAGQPPIVAFKVDTGSKLRWNVRLPAGEFWLIFPREAEIRLDGPGRRTLEGAEFYGAWEGWIAQAWDLSQAAAVRLFKNGQELGLPIPVLGQTLELSLSNEGRLEADLDPDGEPMFIETPPRLRLPLRPGRQVDGEYERWQIKLGSRWASRPVILSEWEPLRKYSHGVTFNTDYLELPLTILLGDKPVGSYCLEVKGPGNTYRKLPFRVWPDLRIEGLQPYFLPETNGSQPIELLLYLPPGSEARPLAEGEGLSIRRVDDHFLLTAGADLSEAGIQLIQPLRSGEAVRVPLTLALPRLRWALPQGAEESAIHWHTSLISLSLPALRQAEHATLLIDLPLVQTRRLQLSLNLFDPASGNVVQAGDRIQKMDRGQKRSRFPLGGFFDTLTTLSDLPVFEFRLQIKDLDSKEEASIPLLNLRRELQIERAWIESQDDYAFTLYWDERWPLRNRRVRIWPRWQPWAVPLEIIIPDEARGEHLFTGARLPPSHYLVHFFTASPWEPKDPYAQAQSSSLVIKAGDPRQRLKWVESQLKKYPEKAFSLNFEQACIHDFLGSPIQRADAVQQCYDHLDQATPPQLLAFANWLAGCDEPTQKAVLSKMYRLETLQRLYQEYPPGNLLRNAYMGMFFQTHLVNPDCAILILKEEIDPAIIRRCLQILIQRKDARGPQIVLEKVEDGRLSEEEAVELLAANPEFCIQKLQSMPSHWSSARLVAGVISRWPGQNRYIVPGFWVESSLGWARVEGLQNQEGENIHFAPLNDRTIRLIVKFSSDQGPIAIFDRERGKLEFKTKLNNAICWRCQAFLHAEGPLIFYHNAIHHPGKEINSKPFVPPSRLTDPIRILPVPPEEVLIDFLLQNQTGLRALAAVAHKPEKRGHHSAPKMISSGCWIRTDAGWGKIIQVLNISYGKQIMEFDPGDEKDVRLIVNLHVTEAGGGPDFSQKIQVDLGAKTLAFLEAGPVKICTRCMRFMFVDHLSATDKLSLLGRHAKDASHKNTKLQAFATKGPIPIKYPVEFRYPEDRPKPLG